MHTGLVRSIKYWIDPYSVTIPTVIYVDIESTRNFSASTKDFVSDIYSNRCVCVCLCVYLGGGGYRVPKYTLVELRVKLENMFCL